MPVPTSALPVWQMALVCDQSNACKSHFSTQGGEGVEQIACRVKRGKSGIKGSSPVLGKGKKEKHRHSKGNPKSLQIRPLGGGCSHMHEPDASEFLPFATSRGRPRSHTVPPASSCKGVICMNTQMSLAGLSLRIAPRTHLASDSPGPGCRLLDLLHTEKSF